MLIDANQGYSAFFSNQLTTSTEVAVTFHLRNGMSVSSHSRKDSLSTPEITLDPYSFLQPSRKQRRSSVPVYARITADMQPPTQNNEARADQRFPRRDNTLSDPVSLQRGYRLTSHARDDLEVTKCAAVTRTTELVERGRAAGTAAKFDARYLSGFDRSRSRSEIHNNREIRFSVG